MFTSLLCSLSWARQSSASMHTGTITCTHRDKHTLCSDRVLGKNYVATTTWNEEKTSPGETTTVSYESVLIVYAVAHTIMVTKVWLLNRVTFLNVGTNVFFTGCTTTFITPLTVLLYVFFIQHVIMLTSWPQINLLGCGGRGVSLHGYSFDKVSVEQNLWGVFSEACWIYKTKN